MLKKLKSAIDKTAGQFRNHPFGFLSERDIQALLFNELRKETISLRDQHSAEGKNSEFGFREPFSINPVTTEYYVPEGKIDVAVFCEEPDSMSDVWRQPCRIAIEIKLWQPREREPQYFRDFELQRYQARLQKAERAFTGIAMLFVHSCAEPRTGTLIPKEDSGDGYPENGIALHFVTHEHHRWQQQYAAPTIPEKVDALAQAT